MEKQFQISNIMAKEYILHAFSVWGIEGTLQKIDELYKHCPGVRAKFYEVYQEILNA